MAGLSLSFRSVCRSSFQSVQSIPDKITIEANRGERHGSSRMNRRRINQISVLLLLLGFGSALAIYLTADHTPINSLLNDPLAHKRYLREMRVIGGKANVLAAEITDWFEGLWEGESLAWTVAVLTVGITLTFRLGAQRKAAEAPPVEENPPPKTNEPAA